MRAFSRRYYFEQPGAYRPGAARVGGRVVRSLQVVSPQSLYDLGLPGNHTQT